ncbi:lipid A export permease/ATP-binding protein MsbA [Faucicola boevrei]|uniref:lipid A export permease/ATP-binding protein MsbA n=1 Tax=Faucicola boevrei TaxID=346665 RepID=UPI00037103A9|nr:lipid A export permease/ATP-binding protein MsbA [Moraxella boevrei]
MSNIQKSAKQSQNWQTYKRLLSYITPYWGAILLMILGFVINAGTEMATAKLMGIITDALADNNQIYKNLLPFLVVVLFVFRGLGSFLGNYFSAIISRNMVFQLRLETFNKLLNLPSEYYLNHSAGEVSAKLIFDVEQVTSAGTDTIKTLLREGLTVVGLFGYLLYLNWKLTAIVFLILPPIAWLIRTASKRFRQLSKDIQDSMGEVSHIANEVIGGYQVVKNYGGQASELARFEQASKNNLVKGLKIVVVNSINTPMIQLLMAMALALVIWIAFRPNVMDGVSAGDFIAYLVAAGLLNRPVKALTDVNQGLQRGLAAADSIFTLLDTDNEKDNGNIEQKLTGNIHFDDVSLIYPDGKKAIDKVNLHIQAGETVALVGRSGAGKTTLVNALMRAIEPSKGKIYLDGVPIDTLTLANLRSQIASVNQQVVLFKATIAQNIAYGELQHKSREQIIHVSKSAYAHEFIEKLANGYDTHIGSDGLQLSGGQRQRLSIARALLKDAPILILDEATSALDNESEFFIQKALEAVMQGRTTIVIAHRLTTIQNADKIVVMDNGAIVEVGNHPTLMAKNGHYARLYERQFND